MVNGQLKSPATDDKKLRMSSSKDLETLVTRRVQQNLRWGCDPKVAEPICNNNRHFAEHAGYFLTTAFLAEVKLDLGEITFYDSNTGKALFQAPHGRSLDDFLTESRNYGWLSFRDDEVIWPNVKLMDNGEVVSIDGTHLGHNLPDMHGRRYCINMVSVAGRPKSDLVEV
ncbi:hypothetical protein MHU86_2573 [Fragilaria crotonensis]|nr:hypothetical protein MHU86_2573 [Fragilaria crotonensis]